MRFPLLHSITPEYIAKNNENEHQTIIFGNIIDYFRTIYTFFHRLCEKKILIKFTIEKLLFINLYFLFAPHEYKILRQSLSWEIIDEEDLYHNLFQTMIRAVIKEGNKKKKLDPRDALEKEHYKYRLITLLTIFFSGKQCFLPLVFFLYIHLLSF